MTGDVVPMTQHAIQLVGPGELRLNTGKSVVQPAGYQILARVEAVGLCFSDLKLLRQFSQHARKGEILRGIDRGILEGIPSYVPGDQPTVPGHEVACRIVAIGEKVRHHRVGERCLVQTDYRELQTGASNAAFGYNFEGGLQEYVLMDERVVMDPKSGERFLISVDETLSASAIALSEPWACVENSYVNPERGGVKRGGRLLVVVERGHRPAGLRGVLHDAVPGSLTAVCTDAEGRRDLAGLDIKAAFFTDPSALSDESFDDIIYFGARKEVIELLNDKLAAHGIINVVTGGRPIGVPVSVGIGRVHYGMTRWIGSFGLSAADSYALIPPTGGIRPGEKIAVIGAAGPMGQMHVIRALCLETEGISLVAADRDERRLEALRRKAAPLAGLNNVRLEMVNTACEPLVEGFTYFTILVPAGELVAEAVEHSMDRSLINIFAGLPAAARHPLNLDIYISNRCYMFGTSGSVLRDMNIVLRKVSEGRLDTNCSVDAISGMAGVADGIAAVENRTLAGKIVVYPALRDVGLIPLAALGTYFPSVGAKLDRGLWTKAAEEELLRQAGGRHSS